MRTFSARSTLRHARRAIPLMLALAMGSTAVWSQQPSEDFRPYLLLLSDKTTEQARAIDRAITAAELDRAVDLLQKLIESGDGQLVRRNALEPNSKDTPLYRNFEVYAGARAYAQEVLLNGPRALRRAYERRFGAEARSRFERARDAGDEPAVEALLKRFVATPSGTLAARWLADRALERGDLVRFDHWVALATLAAEDDERTSTNLESRRWITRLLQGGSNDPRAPRDPRGMEGRDVLTLGGQDVPLAEFENETVRAQDQRRAIEAQEYPAVALPTSNRSVPPLQKPTMQWEFKLLDGPFRTERRNGTLANTHPIVHQGLVLFTDSLRAYALDLYVGPNENANLEAAPTPLWSSEWSAGMTEDEASQRDGRNAETILAGAAANGIFVVPLQVRISQLRQTFRDYEITPPVPTRRLFAFDASTGRPIWSHWREDLAGSEISERTAFLERAFVAGPPVIEGQCVVVPMYISEARFKYFVACFDLRTGATLWVRYLLTGQKEMNMFGHIVEEFAGSPVLIDRGVVYAVSNLGAVAALDLVDGEVRWMSTYNTLPLPPPAIQPREREKVWLNQPPALVGDVLCCTPIDSDFLCTFDAATGAPYLSGPGWQYLLPPADNRLNSMLYVDANRIIVGTTRGIEVLPHPKPAKRFTRRGPREWARLGENSYYTIPRGGATDSQLFLTDRVELYEFDLQDGGSPRNSESISAVLGNCLVADGVLLVASNASITAFFDRQSVERSILSRASSGGLADRLRYAQYLERDAVRRYQKSEGRAGDEALARASSVLAADRDAIAARTVLARLALLQAEQADLRGESDTAIQKLEEALALVADGEMRWRALVTMERVLRARNEFPPSYTECLARLESEFRDRAFPLENGATIRTGAYVAWRRYAQARAARDLSAQLSALNRILIDHPDERWEGDLSGERARITVRELLDIYGRTAYEPFEREAAALARSAADKPDELEAIAKRYPNSRTAENIRLQLISDTTDLARSMRAARAALENGATFPAIHRRIAETATAAGGSTRAAAILRQLAQSHGEEVSEHPLDQGQSFAQLAPPLTVTAPPLAPPDEVKLDRWDAPWGSDLTRAVLEIQGEDLLRRGLVLLQRGHELSLYEVASEAREPLRLIWAYAPPFPPRPVPWHRRVAIVKNRLVFAASERLIWLDLKTGNLVQETPLPRGWRIGLPLESSQPCFALENGVATVLATEYERGTGAQQIVAFDAENGALLWQRPSPFPVMTAPIAGAGTLVLLGERSGLGQSGASRAPLAIFDVQTGWLRHQIRIPAEIDPSRRHRAGLIMGSQLFLRHLSLAPGVLAIDLELGRVAWSDTDEPLDDAAFSPHRPWFLFRAGPSLCAAVPYFDARIERERMTFSTIDTSNGKRREVAVLGPFDQAQGLWNDPVFEIENTEFVIWEHDGSRESSVPRFSLLDLATGSKRFAARNASGLANAKLDAGMAPKPPFASLDDRSILLQFTSRMPNGRTETIVRRFSARHGEPWSPPFPMPNDEISSLTTVGGCYLIVGPNYLSVLRNAESLR